MGEAGDPSWIHWSIPSLSGVAFQKNMSGAPPRKVPRDWVKIHRCLIRNGLQSKMGVLATSDFSAQIICD